MAVQIISGLSTGLTHTAGDTIILTETGRIQATADEGIKAFHSGTINLQIFGAIYAANDGLDLGTASTDTAPINILIGQGGLISAGGSAIEISRDSAEIVNHGELYGQSHTIFFDGVQGFATDSFSIVNSGIISSVNGNGIRKDGTGGLLGLVQITNTGSISGDDDNNLRSDAAILVDEENLVIFNGDDGVISGGGGGISHDDALEADFTLVNSGGIYGTYQQFNATSTAVLSEAETANVSNLEGGELIGTGRGLVLSTVEGFIENAGTISGDSRGIDFIGRDTEFTASRFELVNSGSILSNGDGIEVETTSARIQNFSSGVIEGREGITLVSNSLVLYNAGVIRGGSLDGVDGSVVGSTTITNAEGGVISGSNEGLEFSAGESLRIINSGTIEGQFGDGIEARATTANIFNGSTGVIYGGAYGLFNSGIGDFKLQNEGEILGFSADGVFSSSDEASIANSGTISGGLNGIRLSGSNDDIVRQHIVRNTGRIESTDAESVFSTGTAIEAVWENLTVFNGEGGVIQAYFDSVFLDDNSTTSDNTLVVVNSGTIQSDTGYAVHGVSGLGQINNLVGGQLIGGVFMGDLDGSVTNSGSISGTIEMNAGADTVFNEGSGAINAEIDMGSGDDSVRNRGDMIGGVVLGEGADVLNNSGRIEGNITAFAIASEVDADVVINRGTLIGNVELGAGNDRLVNIDADLQGAVDMGDGADVVRNNGSMIGDVGLGEGADILINNGRVEGDILGYNAAGEVDVDAIINRGTLIGDVDLGAGNDRVLNIDANIQGDVFLGDGADLFNGQGGTHFGTVFGGSGSDVLIAGDSGSELVGGANLDSMFGGEGADVFRYLATTDSNSTGFDRIVDFESGQDIIDLEAVFDAADTSGAFVGSAGFTGGGQGSVRATQAQGNTFVRIDVDGDGSQDMLILLRDFNAADLEATDFLF